MARLRAAIITDIHYGPDTGAKLGTKAPKLLEAFVKAVNGYDKGEGPDLVVDMGDRVTARDADEARRNMETVCAYFNRLAAPVHCINGNHDLGRLTRQENEAITGSPAASYSLDEGGFHLVFFNPSGAIGRNGALVITDDDMEWLRRDLAATDKRTIVFSHVPLDNVSEEKAQAAAERMVDASGEEIPIENAGFRDLVSGRFGYPEQGAAIRAIMEESGKVALCMSGHVHGNRRRDLNGIAYITQQSLTHQHQKFYRVPSRTYSFLEADDDGIVVKLRGKVVKDYVIEFQAPLPAKQEEKSDEEPPEMLVNLPPPAILPPPESPPLPAP